MKITNYKRGHPRTPDNVYASGGCKLCVRNKARKWHENNHERALKNMRDRSVNRPERVLLQKAKARAKEKGLPFDLIETDIVIPKVCPIFGFRLERGVTKTICPTSPTLDRINNAKGYTKNNVWVISWRANDLKGNSTLEELETLVRVWREKLPS